MHQTPPSTAGDSCQTSSFKVHFQGSFTRTLESDTATQMWFIQVKTKCSSVFVRAGNNTQLSQCRDQSQPRCIHLIHALESRQAATTQPRCSLALTCQIPFQEIRVLRKNKEMLIFNLKKHVVKRRSVVIRCSKTSLSVSVQKTKLHESF